MVWTVCLTMTDAGPLLEPIQSPITYFIKVAVTLDMHWICSSVEGTLRKKDTRLQDDDLFIAKSPSTEERCIQFSDRAHSNACPGFQRHAEPIRRLIRPDSSPETMGPAARHIEAFSIVDNDIFHPFVVFLLLKTLLILEQVRWC